MLMASHPPADIPGACKACGLNGDDCWKCPWKVCLLDLPIGTGGGLRQAIDRITRGPVFKTGKKKEGIWWARAFIGKWLKEEALPSCKAVVASGEDTTRATLEEAKLFVCLMEDAT